MQKVEEEGEIVMVKEHRELDRTGTRKGHIVIKVKTPSNLDLVPQRPARTWSLSDLLGPGPSESC